MKGKIQKGIFTRIWQIKVVFISILLFIITLLIITSSEAATPHKKHHKKRATPKQVLKKEDILEMEERLAALGYWTGPIDGVWDDGSRHALIAFQKISDRKRTGRLTTEELIAIRQAERPTPYEGGETHIEVDIKRQILFVVVDSKVERILPVSTGSEKLYEDQGQICRAHTPLGRFKIYNKIYGWRKSTLGLLYYPNYFHRGIAIHGNPSVPTYPASHGCVRIPMFAAQEMSKITPIGLPILVHDGNIPTAPE